MALSAELEKVGLPPDNVDAKATVALDKVESGFAVTSSHLEVTVKLRTPDRPSSSGRQRRQAGCPISRLLNAKITLDARLA